MSMTIRDTDLPQPLTKAWKLALKKKRYEILETPPEPEGVPTLLEYVAAGYPAENYGAFVGRRVEEQTYVDDDDDEDRTHPAMVVDGELSRMPED
jgi:hypothetical protein